MAETCALPVQVEAANAEVEASNKQRASLSSSMLERMKKANEEYEVCAYARRLIAHPWA